MSEFTQEKFHYYDAQRQQLGLKSVWSLYEVDDLATAHPYTGARQVVYRDYDLDVPVTMPINGDTWADLYVSADECIRNSGDNHHIYVEAFVPNKNDATQLLLYTGS